MKQKNMPLVSVVYINEPYLEAHDYTVSHEMAFDEKNIAKLITSPAYMSAMYHSALRYIH